MISFVLACMLKRRGGERGGGVDVRRDGLGVTKERHCEKMLQCTSAFAAV